MFRKTLLTVLFLSYTISPAFAEVFSEIGGKYQDRNLFDSGGPDEFGYTWMDSNEPDGPVYNWIDITIQGQLVTGLGDDDYVGPFDIGFELNYYWYTVESLFIGSNGYIAFDQGGLLSQPFPDGIPNTMLPNNFVAPYAADWYPGLNGIGETWFWTNSTDSVVVSFINYPAFYIGGSHDFQVIFTNSTNSIKFQYGQQQGFVLNNDILIGIESLSGTVGLEHSHNGYITGEDFAIEFYYPVGGSFEYTDMAAASVENDNSAAFFMLSGSILFPSGVITNVGTENVSDYFTQYFIEDSAGSTIYSSTRSPSLMEPGQSDELFFSPSWMTPSSGRYDISLLTVSSEDQNPTNDTIRTSCHVIDLPGLLEYDDGTAEMAWTWTSGDGGLAQRFAPPAYASRIDSISFFIAEDVSRSTFIARILDDDGINNSPGTILIEDSIETTSDGYYILDLISENIMIDSGAFYVAWIMVDDSTAGIGVDIPEGKPASRQTWEFTGSWMPFRHNTTHDAMIGCYVSHEPLENSPPSITARFPVQPDTSLSGPEHLFWASAQDPDQDPLNWTISLNGSDIAEDSSTVITFDSSGTYIVTCTVSDGELADSTTWNVEVFIDGIDHAVTGAPKQWTLYPVFPNPFNNSTTINFNLSQGEEVQLNLYDLQGRQVLMLASGLYSPGSHSRTLEMSNLASGIYFLQLKGPERSSIQKIIFLK